MNMKKNKEITTPRFSVVRLFVALIRRLLKFAREFTSLKGENKVGDELNPGSGTPWSWAAKTH